MAIEYRFEKGIFYPVVVCDTCGELIKDVAKGIVVFDNVHALNKYSLGPWSPVFKHKGPKCDPKSERTYPWFELREFLYQLVGNSGLDLEKAKRLHEISCEVGFAV